MLSLVREEAGECCAKRLSLAPKNDDLAPHQIIGQMSTIFNSRNGRAGLVWR